MTTDIANIEAILGSFKDEVKDLHPHLKEFFNKLSGVEHVEYTHGPDEQGADFILTRKNNLTEQVGYVGVIVKNSKITQSSISEVFRQIEECTNVKRLIKSGAHHIRVDEIWIVANGNISKNAKEKIHEMHKTGIVFTGRTELATLMAKHKYAISTGLSTNISICLDKQYDLATTLNSQSLSFGISKLDNVFMDQSVIRREPTQYTYKKQAQTKQKRYKQKRISIKSAIEDNRIFLLSGEPGSGKSRMLHNVLSGYATVDEFKKTKMIPIFVTCMDMLKKYDRKITQLVECFEKEHNLINIELQFHYIVIIDGIDECDLSLDERINIIKEWKAESSPEKIKRMIFASRDYMEEKDVKIPTYRIADLSVSEIIKTIKKHLSHLNSVDRIVNDIHHSDIFRSLPRSPLATIVLINLLKDEKGRHEVPANLTDLFAKYAEWALGRWDINVEEGIKQRKYEAADKILTKISVYMLNQGIIQLNENEARNFFKTYLKERNLGIQPDELFDSVTNHSNLLYLNDGIFRFRHRTIAEFFYSKEFSDRKIDEIGDSIFDVRWATILFFYVGSKKDCPELLTKIDNLKPLNESGKIMKAINMANILLAGYATPYNHIQKILKSIFIDVSKYLDDVFNQRIENSGFYRLTVMQVLLLFRIMMDYEYSRPFFKEAIEDSLMEIEDMNIDNDIKSTSLFLLNLSYRSLGGDDIFTGMIRKLGSTIPAQIQLAINHETDAMKHVEGDIKKFKRIVRKNLLKIEKTHAMIGLKKSSSVSNLYNKEIRYLPNPRNEN